MMNYPYPAGSKGLQNANTKMTPSIEANRLSCAAETAPKTTTTDELLRNASGISERILNASLRLRAFNERMGGILDPEGGPHDAPPVTGMLSALAHQIALQRSFLAALEEQLSVTEGI